MSKYLIILLLYKELAIYLLISLINTYLSLVYFYLLLLLFIILDSNR